MITLKVRQIINRFTKVCLFCSMSSSIGVYGDDSISNNLRKWLQNPENNNQLSGSLLIAQGDQILLQSGFGYANKETKKRFNKNTVFDIGSITKQYTAAAILRLEEQGLISIEDKLSKYFPNIPKDKRNITVHQLLTHTSGLKRDFKDDYDKVTKENLLEGAFRSKLRSTPGERYRYSNLGYSLLCTMIENIAEMNYEVFLHKEFFTKLQMNNTGYVRTSWHEAELVVGYEYSFFGTESRWGTPLDHNWAVDGPWWNLRGNGGLLSTTGDMFKWHTALKSDKVLSRSSRKKMFQKHVAENQSGESYYGYGWVIADTSRNTRIIFHDGGNEYFFTDFRRYMDEDVVIIFATNDLSTENFGLYRKLRKFLFRVN